MKRWMMALVCAAALGMAGCKGNIENEKNRYSQVKDRLDAFATRTPSLKSDIQTKLVEFDKDMKAAEGKMEPVLAAFKDQVLFLKHNLNAAAINSLQSEAVKIESDVAGLIAEMQKSIDEADKFIASMPKDSQ